MNLFFLEAATRLSKTHTRQSNGEIKTETYPMVKNFTSYKVVIAAIADFYQALLDHSQRGHALLKGQLTEPLVNESKAGKVNAHTETQFIGFDLDGLDVSSAEDFIQSYLPFEFRNVSYILQYSNGYKISKGFKAHIFFLLDSPVVPALLKTFIIHLNLTQFANQLTLSPGNLTLSYPLDPNFNHNAVPIYIANPTCIGFDDPLPDRIQLVSKSLDTVDYAFEQITNPQPKVKTKIAEIRQNLGLKRTTAKVRVNKGVEILENVEEAQLYGAPFEERGFVYLPLSPTNRYSYYHPKDNPSIIYNFKGEPAAETAKLLPDYWRSVNPQTTAAPINATQDNGKTFLIFREIRLDTYYNGSVTDHEVRLYPTSTKERLQDFAAQNNVIMPDPIPDWLMEFDPTSGVTIDYNKQIVNTYRMTHVIKEAINNPQPVHQVPPTIHDILWSVVGNDQVCYDYFLNWLAFIVQKRTKTKTAWVFQGVEGTGKGVLFNLILRPILGAQYCAEKLLRDLDDQFNHWVSESLLIFFDETKHDKQDKLGRYNNIPNLLKNLITEPIMSVRAMRTNPYQAENFSNCIFATNNADALVISKSDRRYNVCPEQRIPYVAPLDLEERLANELQDFTHFLFTLSIDEQAVKTALDNLAKQQMRQVGMGDVESFFYELEKGNFEYFADTYWDVFGLESGAQAQYKNIIYSWALRTTIFPDAIPIRRDELMAVFCTILKIRDMTTKRFTRLMSKAGITVKRKVLRNLDRPTGIKDTQEQLPIISVRWTQGLDHLEAIIQNGPTKADDPPK